MPQLPSEVIKNRAKILRNLGELTLKKYLKKRVGKKIKVLIEQVQDSKSTGKCQHFTKVEIPQTIKEGSIVDCIVTDINKNISLANLIS